MLGASVIGVFGENFQGGKLYVEDELASGAAGYFISFHLSIIDVVILRCKIRNLPMPLHELTNITSGERISVILSTVYFPKFEKVEAEWTEARQ